jgi:putative phosphoesterase
VLLAIVSDTHMPRGARDLPVQCEELCREADLILHAGDFCEASVLERFQDLGRVAAVHGNMDSAQLRRTLPESRLVSAGGARIAIVHDAGPAAGRLQRQRARFPDADAVVFGHSHMPLHEAAGGFAIFNPGSPTERRRAPAHTMGLARVDEGTGLEFELVTLG